MSMMESMASFANLEALDVLAADVEDEISTCGSKCWAAREVGDGLDHAVVQMESVLDQLLAVAGGGAASGW